ncbi:MAG: hypothetical protein QGI83_16845 [Candidatus Latescibacteria bacterium]|jgi:predicted RNA-binding protein|nr:hypothetical protein [Candidatus Latescibacterota bacterium]
MDLKFESELFEKKIDPENGNILFYRSDMSGLPDKVLEGDGFTVEIKDDQVYLIDIFNSKKVLENLLRNVESEQAH